MVCLAAFALRQVGLGVGAASVALLAVGAALSWLYDGGATPPQFTGLAQTTLSVAR